MWMCPRCKNVFEVQHTPHECVGGEMVHPTYGDSVDEEEYQYKEDAEEGYRTPFERDLASLINRHSLENASNTPDMILAAFMLDVMLAWNARVGWRERWYGVSLRPGTLTVPKWLEELVPGDDRIETLSLPTARRILSDIRAKMDEARGRLRGRR